VQFDKLAGLGSEYEGIGWLKNFRLISMLAGGTLFGGEPQTNFIFSISS